ncbi:MAG: BON domain-containing protein [Planctomycetia bacterium]
MSGTGLGGGGFAGGSSTSATDGFVGGNQSGDFVGAGQQGTSTNTNRQFQAFQDIQNNLMQGTQSARTPRQIKTALRVNFSFPAVDQSRSSVKLSKANAPSLDRYVTRYPELSGIVVSLQENGVVVLSGETNSVESARLAANLVRLQPGVRRVENQTNLR